MQRHDLTRMNREQLIAEAERLGVPRPRVLTQPELMDEIITRTTTGDRERAKARGWLGRARDLLANVVERGLHLPEAARVLRSPGSERAWPAPPPPLPTVTLAEIYAAQGHLDRAVAVLDEVIAREPDHREAHALRARFVEQAQRSRSRAGKAAAADEASKSPPSMTEPPATRASPEASVPAEARRAVAETKPASEPVKRAPLPVHEPFGPVTSPSPAASAQDEGEASPLETDTMASGPPSAMTEVAASDPLAETMDAIASTEPAVAAAEPAAEAAEPAAEAAEAAEPAPLDEPALPDRYEVDEVVAIAVDPRTIYLYWEVRATTLAHARARRPDGWLGIRVASVTASWEGPRVDTRDLRVDALYGDRFLRDVQPGSNVRVSVGWRTDDAFEPLAVGVEVTAPRMVPVASVSLEVARWEAVPVAPFQSRRAEVPPASLEPEPYLPPLAAPARRFEERLVAATRAPSSGRGGPVDTGVEIWGGRWLEPRVDHDEPADHADEPLVEGPWYQPGGSSELGRGGPGRTRPRPGRPGPSWQGGASELARP
jgi:hypothetical protein